MDEEEEGPGSEQVGDRVVIGRREGQEWQPGGFLTVATVPSPRNATGAGAGVLGVQGAEGGGNRGRDQGAGRD